MSAFRDLSADRQRRLEEASSWRLRFRSDSSLELSAEFREWSADPRNLRALEAVEESWDAVGDLGTAPQILEMRRAALARVQRAGARRWQPRKRLWRAAAALIVIGLVGGAALYVVLRQPTTYETDIGERRVVALPDGSRISLDSDTEVRVRFSEAARAISMDRGRARFDVAHDVTRPFTVTAGAETVVAVGTSFNVEKLGSRVLVTLIQGHVVVKSAAAGSASNALIAGPRKPRPAISLNAGELLVAQRDAKPVIASVNLQNATAWEAGHLVFKDETLEEAAVRVNRYTSRPVIVDASVASLRISGVFNAGDIGSFVSAVTSYFPVQATTNADNTILLQRRS